MYIMQQTNLFSQSESKKQKDLGLLKKSIGKKENGDSKFGNNITQQPNGL